MPKPDTEASWRQLQQGTVGTVKRPRRLWRHFPLRAVASVAGCLLLAGLGWVAWERIISVQNGAPAATESEGLPWRRVYFETDGVLGPAWLRERLDSAVASAVEPDLEAIRRALLADRQVRRATVERIHPDRLRILIAEQRPMLRVAANGPNGPEFFLVSTTGVIYRHHHYPEAAIARMPFLGGVRLRRLGDGFAPVTGADRLADFLATAAAKAPELSRRFRVIDARHALGPPDSLGAYVTVRTGDGTDIHLNMNDFDSSLDRLKRIDRARRVGELPRFAVIDLRQEDPVLRASTARP